MAGRGPAPKPADRRARSNPDPVPQTVLNARPVKAPSLPRDVDWHPRTKAWWNTWKSSPQASTFTATDWSFLLDTALMHHAMWSKGQWTLAAEVRLRVAKFGATPEDRARLRMVFAGGGQAEPAEDAPAGTPSPARARRGPLRAV
jgi:hypothetical protein